MGLLPLSPSATPWERLGFAAPRFGLDERELERAWLQASRATHPDRFAGKPDAERRLAAERTIALNDAYKALRDPFDRARSLVRHAGVAEGGLDQGLLVELMEWREQAEESAAGKQAVLDGARARFFTAQQDVATRLLRQDATGYEAANDNLRQVARRLAEMKTLARLVDDLGGGKLISTLDGR